MNIFTSALAGEGSYCMEIQALLPSAGAPAAELAPLHPGVLRALVKGMEDSYLITYKTHSPCKGRISSPQERIHQILTHIL